MRAPSPARPYQSSSIAGGSATAPAGHPATRIRPCTRRGSTSGRNWTNFALMLKPTATKPSIPSPSATATTSPAICSLVYGSVQSPIHRVRAGRSTPRAHRRDRADRPSARSTGVNRPSRATASARAGLHRQTHTRSRFRHRHVHLTCRRSSRCAVHCARSSRAIVTSSDRRASRPSSGVQRAAGRRAAAVPHGDEGGAHEPGDQAPRAALPGRGGRDPALQRGRRAAGR